MKTRAAAQVYAAFRRNKYGLEHRTIVIENVIAKNKIVGGNMRYRSPDGGAGDFCGGYSVVGFDIELFEVVIGFSAGPGYDSLKHYIQAEIPRNIQAVLYPIQRDVFLVEVVNAD